jgi:hypothetical protein
MFILVLVFVLFLSFPRFFCVLNHYFLVFGQPCARHLIFEFELKLNNVLHLHVFNESSIHFSYTVLRLFIFPLHMVLHCYKYNLMLSTITASVSKPSNLSHFILRLSLSRPPSSLFLTRSHQYYPEHIPDNYHRLQKKKKPVPFTRF